jgi:hypothetical protein
VTSALRKAGWSSLGLAVVGCALLALSFLHPHRAEALPRFGGLALLYLAGLTRFHVATRTLARELGRAARRACAREERLHVLVVAAVVLIGLAVRLQFIDEPMRYDESYSFLHFVARPLDIGLTRYPLPNNHVFQTLLAHVAWLALGDDPPVLRLPALVAGVAVVPATYLAGRALYDRDAGLLAAGLAAPAAALVEYSVNARGYTIVCAAFLLVLALGARLIARANPAGWIVWTAIAAIGLYAIPIMAFGLAIVGAWLGLRIALETAPGRRLARARDLALALAAASATALLLYIPTLDQHGWRYEHPSHWSLLTSVWNLWNAGIPTAVRVALAGGVVAAVILHRRIGRQRVPVIAGLAALPLALIVATRVPPFARSWVFLQPLYLVLAAAGLVAAARMAVPRAAPALAALAAIVASAGLGLTLSARDLPSGPDPPLRDGERTVRFLKTRLRPGERVVVSALAAPNFRYYFRHLGLSPGLVVSDLRSTRQGRDRAILIVSRVRHETLAGTLQQLRRDRPSLKPPWLIRSYRWESLYELVV